MKFKIGLNGIVYNDKVIVKTNEDFFCRGCGEKKFGKSVRVICGYDKGKEMGIYCLKCIYNELRKRKFRTIRESERHEKALARFKEKFKADLVVDEL